MEKARLSYIGLGVGITKTDNFQKYSHTTHSKQAPAPSPTVRMVPSASQSSRTLNLTLVSWSAGDQYSYMVAADKGIALGITEYGEGKPCQKSGIELRTGQKLYIEEKF